MSRIDWGFSMPEMFARNRLQKKEKISVKSYSMLIEKVCKKNINAEERTVCKSVMVAALISVETTEKRTGIAKISIVLCFFSRIPIHHTLCHFDITNRNTNGLTS